MPTLAGLNRSAVGVLSLPLSWSQFVLLFLFLPLPFWLCLISLFPLFHLSFYSLLPFAITHCLRLFSLFLPSPPFTLTPSLFLSLCSLPVVLLRGICCCREKGMSAWISTLSQQENTHIHKHAHTQVYKHRRQMATYKICCFSVSHIHIVHALSQTQM